MGQKVTKHKTTEITNKSIIKCCGRRGVVRTCANELYTHSAMKTNNNNRKTKWHDRRSTHTDRLLLCELN